MYSNLFYLVWYKYYIWNNILFVIIDLIFYFLLRINFVVCNFWCLFVISYVAIRCSWWHKKCYAIRKLNPTYLDMSILRVSLWSNFEMLWHWTQPAKGKRDDGPVTVMVMGEVVAIGVICQYLPCWQQYCTFIHDQTVGPLWCHLQSGINEKKGGLGGIHGGFNTLYCTYSFLGQQVAFSCGFSGQSLFFACCKFSLYS